MTTFSRTSRTVAIVTTVVGGLVLVGIGTSAAVAAIRTTNFTGEHRAQSLSLAELGGITGLEVESNSSQFTIEFADVSEATLNIEGDSRYFWEMKIDEDEIVVKSKSSLADFCMGWCAAGNERVTLTLPNELSNGKLLADLTINAGSMTAAGEFSTLDIELNAGAMTFEGAARSLETTVNAGRANLIVDSVNEADIEVSAGSVTAVFTGTAPQSTSLDVSAGALTLTLPDTDYRVTSSIEVGRFTNDLRESSTSRNLIDASVEAGKLTLKAK